MYPTLQRIDQDSVETATIRAARNAEVLVEHGYTTVRDVAIAGRGLDQRGPGRARGAGSGVPGCWPAVL